MLRILSLLLLLTCSALTDPREERENVQWIGEIRRYAETQPAPVREALETIVRDAQALGELSQHKEHDSLQASLSKIDRARLDPEGAIARERLDSPVGNFGEVSPGKLYRGAQPSAAGLRWLQQQGVKTVVVVREPGVEETNYPNYSRQEYLADIRSLGMTPVELVVRDHTVPAPEQVNQFLRVVGEASSAVFFHCSAGVGRTGILAGLWERSQGVEAAEALQHSKRFQLRPALVPDHALQASLLANYPLAGHSEVVDLPWGVVAANPLKAALTAGRGFVFPASARLRLDLANPEPALKRLSQVLRSQEFVCLEFTSAAEVDMLASLARVVPVAQKMGSLRLGQLTVADLDRARRLLGPVPFEVVVEPEKLTEAFFTEIEGHAEVLDVGLNPPEAVLEQMAKHGLVCHLRPDPKLPLAHYDAVGIGYLSQTP